MTRSMTIRALFLATLSLLIAGPAFAQKGNDKAAKEAEKKKKEALIKQLEEKKHELREQEKVELKRIDERFKHIIEHLEPHHVKHQLEEGVHVLQQVHHLLTVGDFDYGGHRHAAEEATEKAQHQLELAIRHDTAEERSKAAHDIEAAHHQLSKALEFSIKKYGTGEKKEKGEPETRAAANRQLVEAIQKIELVHHLLKAVDHEIKDYKEEKKELLKKRDHVKHELKEHVNAEIKAIDEEIHKLKK